MPYTKTKTEFLELYRTWSDEQLLEIVKRPEHFQLNAVSAAEAILAERGIHYETAAVEEPAEEELDVSYREQVETELTNRINSGESPEAVLLDLKSRGIESVDFLPGQATDQHFKPQTADQLKGRKGYFVLLIAIILLVIRLLYRFTRD